MKNIISNKIINFFSGDKLSIKVKKNIVYSFILRGFSILVSFYIYRVTFNFLNDESLYGVWLTILSILSWLNFFDIGLGNGLRNKLTTTIVSEDYDLAKSYVSTSYSILFIIILIILSIYFIFAFRINWTTIFNIEIDNNILRTLLNVVVVFYAIKFFLTLINSISYAEHDAVVPSILAVVSNILIILLLLFLTYLNIDGISILGFVYTGVFAMVFFIANIFLFNKRYSKIKPQIKFINFSYTPDLFNLGFKFFIIQISALIIFTTDNIIITQVLGPVYVTPYQVTYKMFNIFNIIAGIIFTPLWSAYTDAYSRRDYQWIKRTLNKFLYLMIPITIGIIIFIIIGSGIIRLWMGESLDVPFLLILFMGIYSLIAVWNIIFASLVNGIGKIKIQLTLAAVGAAMNIPLSIFFCNRIGISGVILGTIISLSFWAFVGPIQVYYLFYKKNISK